MYKPQASHEDSTAALTSKGKERQAVTGEDISKDEEFGILRSEADELPPAQALVITGPGTPESTRGEATRSDSPLSTSPRPSLLMAVAAPGETISRTNEEISGQVERTDSPHSSVTDDASDQERRSLPN